jgi:hypothetical protein
MNRRTARRGLAAACVFVLTTAGVSSAASAEAAPPEPSEVAVVPADAPTTFQADQLYVAGATGFLHRYKVDGPLLWTRYANGTTTPVSDLAGVDPRSLLPAGGDTVSTTAAVPGHSVPGDLTVIDLGRMSWRQLALPASGTLLGFYGDTMLIGPTTLGSGEALLSLRRFAADGSYETVPVTGIPAGITSVNVAAGDATAAVLRLWSGAGAHYGLLDLASGAVAPFPDTLVNAKTAVLSADRVGFLIYKSPTVSFQIYSRAGVATGSDTSPQIVSLPDNTIFEGTVLVGTHVIAAIRDGNSRTPAIDYSTPDRPTVVPMVQPVGAYGQMFLQTADGALVVGGSGPGDWSVRRLTATGDGQVAQATALPLAGPLTNAGLSIARGLLRHVEAQQLAGDPVTRYLLFNHQLVPDSRTVPLDGGLLGTPIPCESGVTCVRTVDSNEYGTSYLMPGSSTSIVLGERDVATRNGIGQVLPSASGALVDASPSYAIVNGSGPATQYIVKPGSATALQSRPVTAAALWFSTLWSSTAAGTLQAKNLLTGAAAAPVATGSSCAATELQATVRQVYWSCGANGPAGVYDTARHASIPVLAGQALLGDGYVVYHDATTGALLRYDLTGGTLGTPVTVATVARGSLADDRGITWAVDKYSGDIAYVDAEDTVHVVDPAVPQSPPAIGAIYPNTEGDIYFAPNPLAWSANVSLTRSIDSWTFTVTQATTGQVVATSSGGTARMNFVTGWNGYLASGAKAASGRYRYTMTATAGGGPATVIGSGTLTVQCGAPNFRSYQCDGVPAVLGVFKSGEAHWLSVDNGKIHDNGHTDDWPLGTASSQASAIIPFGDLNGDGNNDLVVRSGTGTLTVYHGTGYGYFGRGNVTATSLGAGWSGYKQLVSTGDLTGDGIADLLGQDGAGKLWRFNGTSAGKLGPRTALAGTYNQPKLIGPGDINGDGKADLLMVNTSGVLYAVYGTGTGTFGGAHQVSTGWSTPTWMIGAGDLNQDGHNDLSARDRSGNFWMFPGNGKGTFGAGQKLAISYQKYAGMY